MKEIKKSLEEYSNSSDKFSEMALELLQESENPVEIVASVLRQSFSDDLDESNYNEIRRINMKSSGTTRLFVAKGRITSYNVCYTKLLRYGTAPHRGAGPAQRDASRSRDRHRRQCRLQPPGHGASRW